MGTGTDILMVVMMTVMMVIMVMFMMAGMMTTLSAMSGTGFRIMTAAAGNRWVWRMLLMRLVPVIFLMMFLHCPVSMLISDH